METRIASHRHNEAGLVECNRLQVQFEAQNEMTGSLPKTAKYIAVALPPDTKIEQAEKSVGPPVEGNDRLQSISTEKDWFGNPEPGLHITEFI